jgi:hypothetical protein
VGFLTDTHRLPSAGRPVARGGQSAIALGGVLLGCLVVGWPFRSGAMLNMDLVVFDHVPERGTWLGPANDLPRRSIVFGAIARGSQIVSGVTLVRIWMVIIVAAAYSGAVHMLTSRGRSTALPLALGAASLYALSPYLLTRMGVGHLGLATAYALMPWALGALLHPGDSPRRTYVWLVVFAVFGYFGALLALPVVLVGLVADQCRGWSRVVGVAAAAQAVWIVPALLHGGKPAGAATSASFPTNLDDVADALRLAVGHGFWQPSNEIGRSGAATGIALCLLALAYVGASMGGALDRRRELVVGAIGALAAVSTALPGLYRAWSVLTSTWVTGPLREPHRLLALFVLWVCLAATDGVTVLLRDRGANSRAAAAAAMLAGGLVMVGGSLAGLDGRLTALDVPTGWAQLAGLDASDRAVLALPWVQYYDVALADGRRTHHPIPFATSADVVYAHDLELADGNAEGVDPREQRAADIVAAWRRGEAVAEPLADAGFGYIAADAIAAAPDLALLRSQPGIRRVAATEGIELLEVVPAGHPSAPSQGGRPWRRTIEFLTLAVTAGAVAASSLRARARSNEHSLPNTTAPASFRDPGGTT